MEQAYCVVIAYQDGKSFHADPVSYQQAIQQANRLIANGQQPMIERYNPQTHKMLWELHA